MKILHVIATADPRSGGPIEGVFRLGESFRAMGHEQELLTLDLPDDEWVTSAPVKVHALGSNPPALPGILGRIARWAKRSPKAPRWLSTHASDYDGIIVDGLWNYATRTARVGLAKHHTPYIVFSHGMLDPLFRTRDPAKHRMKQVLWQFNEGPLCRGAEALAFTCELERKLARTTFSPWNMREAVVGYGTSPPPALAGGMREAFAACVPGLGGKPYLLFLGRISEIKGVDILLEAFGRMAEDTDMDLVLAGPVDGSYGDLLRALEQQHCPPGRVHWAGMVRGDAKWGAVHGCEALVLPSHHENFGVVVAEAGACSRPVILSDQVKIHGEIVEADAGMVAPVSVDGFEQALRQFSAMSGEERKAMGARGRQLFEERFTMDGVAQRILTIFEAAKSSC